MIQSQQMVNVLLSSDDCRDIREYVQQIETNAHCFEFVKSIVHKLNTLSGETDDHSEIKSTILEFFRNAKSDMSWHAEKVCASVLGEPDRYSEDAVNFDEVYKHGNWNQRDLFSNLISSLNK